MAIQLSLRVAAVATAVATPFGIALAWLLARTDFWGKSLLDALVHLPLVLTPVVTGYLLLLTFSRRGLAGAWLADHLGIVFAFRWTGAAIAALRLVVVSVVIAVAALIGAEWFARRATRRLHGN
jgi:molybdate transport system permease protein